MYDDLSQAAEIADRLLTGVDGRAHLPPALRAEMRALTPREKPGRKPRSSAFTPSELARIRALRATGHSYRDIQRLLKCSYGRVAAACQQFGMTNDQ